MKMVKYNIQDNYLETSNFSKLRRYLRNRFTRVSSKMKNKMSFFRNQTSHQDYRKSPACRLTKTAAGEWNSYLNKVQKRSIYQQDTIQNENYALRLSSTLHAAAERSSDRYNTVRKASCCNKALFV